MRPPRPLVILLCAALCIALAAIAGVLLTGEDGRAARARSGAKAAVNVDRHLPLSPVVPRRRDDSGGTAFIVRLGGRGALGIVARARLPLNPGGQAYAVWLYNSVTDATIVGEAIRTGGGLFQAGGPLPRGYAKRWRYIDVSRQGAPLGGNHSGESVLRGELAP